MEQIMFFAYVIAALIFTAKCTIIEKLSLRQGAELTTPPPTQPGAIEVQKVKDCPMCPRHYKPVCASNGQWYHNPCFMACSVGNDNTVGILYEGVCKPEHMSTTSKYASVTDKCISKCDTAPDHVCATDKKVYHNDCIMTCEAGPLVKVVHHGTKCHYILEYTFSNAAHFVERCSMCKKVYDPVCATNGDWFYNKCVMDCALGNETDITVQYQGRCIDFS